MGDPATTATEAYMADFPADIQARLHAIQEAIRDAEPEAEPAFGYQMPGFKLRDRPLLYYAAFQKHCSLFGATGTLRETMPELAKYKGGKGTIRFPHDEPLPLALVKKVAKQRGRENRSLTPR